jgi:hypothetical protein
MGDRDGVIDARWRAVSSALSAWQLSVGWRDPSSSALHLQDPLTLVTTAVVLLTAVLAASWLPGRRAARIDPVSAMRI